MRNFRIAVIDTALNIDFLIEDVQDKIEVIDFFDCEQKDIHSSMVINTLLKYTNRIEKVYLYNVFNNENKGSGIAVISALKDIILKNDIDFLVMAMTLSNAERYDYIENLCKRITSLGIMIFAADSNIASEDIYYPFSFDCVYGISQASFFKEPYYCIKNILKKHILGDATPEFISCRNNNYILFGGTSKAVPKFLAFIINSFSSKKVVKNENIVELIEKSSLSEEDNCIDKLKGHIFEDTDNRSVYDDLCEFITEMPLDLREYGAITPSFRLEKLRSYNLVVFLNYIFERFSLKVKLENLKYNDFITLSDLCCYIERQL